MSSQATAGTETLVNSYTTSYQDEPSVTALADGGWLVSWMSLGQDGSSYGIYQQRYDVDGVASGTETLVNSYITDWQNNPSVTALADGGWLQTWHSWSQDGGLYGIYQQRYDADGLASGTETLVNSFTPGDQYDSSVTALADGGWVVTWASNFLDGSSYGIYQQRYGADGVASGTETPVNSYTTDYQYKPSVTALADGGWLVTWASLGQDGSLFGIYQQRYDADGLASGTETLVNSYTTGYQDTPSVTALADGGWLVTWSSDGQDGHAWGIYQQRYDADGVASGTETPVNSYTTDDQYQPSVTALADGGWLVTWSSYGQDGEAYGIYQQRYDAEGAASGTETLVNSYTTDYQYKPSVTALVDGGWLVTWASYGQDGSEYGIYQRHFAADVRGGALADILAGTSWDETLIGFGGNDTLDGKGGDDILIGGFGNDIYVVDSTGDQIQEMAVQGTDTVLSSISFSLAGMSSIEHLTLTGSGDINATGNALDNVLTGNSSDNTVEGGGGADTLIGGDGADTLIGGSGNDIYVVESTSDQIQELAAQGTDEVRASVGFSLLLLADVENLTLTGLMNIKATGNATANSLAGNAGKNIIKALDGADILAGGKGNDTLFGGAGIDTFVFNTDDDADRIKDFDSKGVDHDVIDLSGLAAITDFADLKAGHMRQQGANVVINGTQGDMITLEGVRIKDLDAGDFLF
ncbi:calcium-binding protein [Rhizobium sp. LjRoot254]|uniref:calcium-binding protein n=1 Tax=Rhizobium sp. LjRoot254 TaxID=3342297 RepID=UPI003ECE3EF6